MKNLMVIITLIVLSIGVGLYLMPDKTAQTQKSSGEALIGGDFTLINQNGETITDKDFRGKFMLVFFGFTNCPEVCPTGLLTITQAMELLGKDATKIAPVFITVDPKRDTPEQMASYLSNFYPSLTGLTGTPEQVKAVEKVYRVYSSKVVDKTSDEYTMNHSAFVYLMDKNGKFLTHFSHDSETAKMADMIKKYIGK